MHTIQFLDLYAHILLVDFLRYFLAAGTAYLIFWVVFKNRWKRRIIQRKLPQLKKMWFEFRYSMSTVLIFSGVGFCIVTLKNQGYTLIYGNISDWGWAWMFASFALMILLHDAWFYWTHRLMHHPKIFRHVHLVHHRSTNPSPWAAYSFHPIEAVVEAGIFPLIVFTIPAHEITLLAFLLYMITRNVLGHLGIEFLPAWFVKNRWINWHTTTTHHDLHHKYFNSNYGLYFTWWDKWFCTEHPHYQEVFEEVTMRPEANQQPEAPLEADDRRQADAQWPCRKVVASFVLLLFAAGTAIAQSAAGLWQTFHEETGKPLSLIRIEEKNGSLEGDVAKIFLQPWEGEDPICMKCPGTRKDKKVIGMEFM